MEHAIKEEDFLNLNKDKLIDYLKMYKDFNGMKIKVLETLSRDKILEFANKKIEPPPF